MTITTEDASTFIGIDNEGLLEYWEDMKEREGIYRKFRQHTEFEIARRMQAEGATAIPHERLTCELKTPSPDYDWGKLRALAELVPPEELAKGFTPAHEETAMIPDKWDARIFKSWSKYGTPVANIIESAAIPKTPRLIIKRKEEAKHYGY